MKGSIRILSLLFFLQTFTILSQEKSVSWIQNLGGSSKEEANCILPTSDGGLLFAGYSYSDDGLLTHNKGFQDGWLVKTNGAGHINWQKNIGGNWSDVIEKTIETEDGYIICGWSASTISSFVTSKGLEDGFIAKIDKNGNVMWKHAYGGTLMDKLFDIQQLPNGDIVAVGYVMSSEVEFTQSLHKGQLDLWVIRLNKDGNLIWQNAYGGSDDDFAYHLLLTDDHKIIIAGTSNSIDGQVGSNRGEWDCWLLQLNIDGDIEWTNLFGNSNYDEIIDLVAYEKSIYLIGSSNSAGPNAKGKYDAWVVQTDLQGNFLNEFRYGGPENDKIYSAIATENGIYISGETVNNFSKDGWIMQIDGNGSVLSSQLIGGSEADRINDIAAKDEAIYIAGSSYSSDGDMLQNFGSGDALVAKLSQQETTNDLAIRVFPNPADEQITIVLDQIGIEQITIYNSLGQVVQHIPANNFFQEQISIGDLSAGVYTIEIKSNEQMIRSQFIKR